jgi:hypothetical protein
MPLAFESTTHGTFAFGFFNVRSDMLLLDNRFFFATDFCAWMNRLAGMDRSAEAPAMPGWIIDRPEDVGDLMGAIRGRRHTGFIGDTYRRHPFPAAPEEFKQAPEGDGTQAELAAMIEKYARRAPIPFEADRTTGRVAIGGVEVTVAVFHDLLRYVWRGGYPRWRGEVRPAYVVAMKERLEKSARWPLDGIDWEV